MLDTKEDKRFLTTVKIIKDQYPDFDDVFISVHTFDKMTGYSDNYAFDVNCCPMCGARLREREANRNGKNETKS